MGFLDRLVSDMIHRETGFNARRLVRRVGGKNILLLGGAALAGGVLASTQSRHQRSAATTQAGTALPPTKSGPASLPALPQGLPPTPDLGQSSRTEETELPPIPAAAGPDADLEEPPEIPNGLLYAIVRTMVAAALADGELSSEEKEAIEGRLAESGLDADQVAQIRRDLVIPTPVSELAELLPEGEDPEVLVEFAVLVARADGKRTETETAWLTSLGEALALQPGQIESLTGEIFENN